MAEFSLSEEEREIENLMPNGNALDEITDTLKPFLRDKDDVSKLKERLVELGAISLSYFSVLKEGDFPGLITVADFRLMETKINLRNSSGYFFNNLKFI